MVANVSFSNDLNINSYLDLKKQNKSVASAPVLEYKSDEIELKTKNSASKEYTCTDGADDGKLSWKEAGKCIVDGAVRNIKERIEDAKGGIIKRFKENPVKTTAMTLGIAAVTTAIMLSPFAPVAIGILATVGGVIAVQQGVKAVEGIVDAAKTVKNATSDKEAKEAFADIGDNGVDLVESAVELYACTKTATSAFEALDVADDVVDVVDDVDDITKQIDKMQKMADDAKEIKEGLENAVDNADLLKESFQRKSSIIEKIIVATNTLGK